MDRRLKAFSGRQVLRLIEWAENCGDPQLHSDILAMAEEWQLESMEQPVDVKLSAAPSASRGTSSHRSTRNRVG